MKRIEPEGSSKGPSERFSGDVWLDTIARPEGRFSVNVSVVRFSPGSRTAWHSHDGGQTLYVTEGRGVAQSRGGEALELKPGDMVFTPAGEEHWHGASPSDFMTHLSIVQEEPRWGERVSDDDYRAALTRRDGGSAGR